MPREYVFIDEWDVDAPIERVFDALADAGTYPEWWKPVYKSVEVDGPPGRRARLAAAVQGQAAVRADDGVEDRAAGASVLRPLFRWNHNWSIARAIEGLEPYARGRP
jgi:hypothetical protein